MVFLRILQNKGTYKVVAMLVYYRLVHRSSTSLWSIDRWNLKIFYDLLDSSRSNRYVVDGPRCRWKLVDGASKNLKNSLRILPKSRYINLSSNPIRYRPRYRLCNGNSHFCFLEWVDMSRGWIDRLYLRNTRVYIVLDECFVHKTCVPYVIRWNNSALIREEREGKKKMNN